MLGRVLIPLVNSDGKGGGGGGGGTFVYVGADRAGDSREPSWGDRSGVVL